MPISLYDATVPQFQQILAAVAGMLGKAEAHCAANGLAPDEIVHARLADDMLPFANQIKFTAGHSIGAIEGVRAGVFSPDLAPPPADFAALKARVSKARSALAALDPAELEGFIGRDMRFEFRERRLDFTAEGFLLSFSLPNFFFHATTAYDILRAKGVALGKSDFIGRPMLKG